MRRYLVFVITLAGTGCGSRYTFHQGAHGESYVVDGRTGRLQEIRGGAVIELPVVSDSEASQSHAWWTQSIPGFPGTSAALTTRWTRGTLLGDITIGPEAEGAPLQTPARMPDSLVFVLLDSLALPLVEVPIPRTGIVVDMGAHGPSAIHVRFRHELAFDDYLMAKSWRLRVAW